MENRDGSFGGWIEWMTRSQGGQVKLLLLRFVPTNAKDRLCRTQTLSGNADRADSAHANSLNQCSAEQCEYGT